MVDSGYSREEPYAGKPHVRICEGESRMAELLDHPPTPSPEGVLFDLPNLSRNATDQMYPSLQCRNDITRV